MDEKFFFLFSIICYWYFYLACRYFYFFNVAFSAQCLCYNTGQSICKGVVCKSNLVKKITEVYLIMSEVLWNDTFLLIKWNYGTLGLRKTKSEYFSYLYLTIRSSRKQLNRTSLTKATFLKKWWFQKELHSV